MKKINKGKAYLQHLRRKKIKKNLWLIIQSYDFSVGVRRARFRESLEMSEFFWGELAI